MLKIASKSFGISAHHTMKLAEHLYLNGFITYPRTETTHYSENFDFKEILSKLSSDSILGNLASYTLTVFFYIVREKRILQNLLKGMMQATIRL